MFVRVILLEGITNEYKKLTISLFAFNIFPDKGAQVAAELHISVGFLTDREDL